MRTWIVIVLLSTGCAAESLPLDNGTPPVNGAPEGVYVPPDVDYPAENLGYPGVSGEKANAEWAPNFAFDEGVLGYGACVAPDGSMYPCVGGHANSVGVRYSPR
jgi:hypothetical protein